MKNDLFINGTIPIGVEKRKKDKPMKFSDKVHCRECRNSKDFINNSCFCKAFKRRLCACNRYGRVCDKYVKKT